MVARGADLRNAGAAPASGRARDRGRDGHRRDSPTGGFEATVGGVRILARDVFNPLQVLWTLLGDRGDGVVAADRSALRPRRGAVAPRRWSPGAQSARRRPRRPADSHRRRRRDHAWRGRVAALLLAECAEGRRRRHADPGKPVSRRVGRGDPGWCNTGSRSIHRGRRAGSGSRRSSSWSGHPQPLEATAPCVTGRRSAACSLSWALGRHLRVLRRPDRHDPPQTLLRLGPIAANARAAGPRDRRGLACRRGAGLPLRSRGRESRYDPMDWRRRRWPLIILIDYSPAPFPMVEARSAAIYQTLRDRPEQGALLVWTSRRNPRQLRPAGASSITGCSPTRPSTPSDRGGVVSRMSPSVAERLRRPPCSSTPC